MHRCIGPILFHSVTFVTYFLISLCCAFQIRVGHFEPEQINLTGEGVFPRISLDLPRDTENDSFKELLETAQQNLANVEKIIDDDSDVFLEVRHEMIWGIIFWALPRTSRFLHRRLRALVYPWIQI